MDLNRKNTANACSEMITSITQLKLSILDLFRTLADNGNQGENLVNYVERMISLITATIRNLDLNIVVLLQNSSLITTGESEYLGMDGSLDKHNLYMDLCKTYKTYTKLHDYSAHCHALLHQQSLKRVHKRFETSSNNQTVGGSIGLASATTGPGGARDPRADSIVATFNPYIYKICSSRQSIMTMLNNCLKLCDSMDGAYSQPFGTSTGVFQISVNRVLKAILVMRGIVIDAVIVKAYHESFALKATSKPISSNALIAAELPSNTSGGSHFVDPEDDIDLWSESKYAVFRKLTHHANAAVLHFQYPTYPEIAVRSFLMEMVCSEISLHSFLKEGKFFCPPDGASLIKN